MIAGNASRREEVRSALDALRIDRAAERVSGPRSAKIPRKAIAATLAGACAAAAVWVTAASDAIRVEVGYASRAGGADASAPVLSGSGYVVTGDRYVSLSARVSGRVAQYLVEEGEQVAAGQALVRLDDRGYAVAVREARASQRIAEANVELRRKELARLRGLYERGAASQAALDLKDNELQVAEAEVDGLDARLARLRLDLEETVVRAPTGGVVLEKLKEVGEMAIPGGFSGSSELIRIANLDDLRAEVEVNETDLAKVELGQRSEIVPDAFPTRRYAAEVAKLYPQINRQKGTLRVEVRILTPDEALRPDMSVRVQFFSGESQPTQEPLVTAPRQTIREDARGHYVWSIQAGRVTRRAVELGPGLDGDRVRVRRGLAGGETLVSGDAPEIQEASAVEVAN